MKVHIHCDFKLELPFCGSRQTHTYPKGGYWKFQVKYEIKTGISRGFFFFGGGGGSSQKTVWEG